MDDRARRPRARRRSATGLAAAWSRRIAATRPRSDACRERPAAGEHLVEHGAEREHVRPRVRRVFPPPVPATCRRACPSRCRAASRNSRWRPSAPASHQLREAEVEHLRAAVARDGDVRRLDVAVDDAAARARAASAAAICVAYSSAVRERQRRRARARGRAASPSTSSIAMNVVPASSPTSWMVTM